MILHHVGYVVPNIETAIPYWEGLGARVESPIIEITHHQARVCFLQMAGQRIELVMRPTTQEVVKGQIDHLCFLCDDFDNQIATARERGGLVVKSPVPSEAFQGRLMCFIYYKNIGLIEWIDNRDRDSP